MASRLTRTSTNDRVERSLSKPVRALLLKYTYTFRNVSTTLRHPQAAFSEPRSVKDGA